MKKQVPVVHAVTVTENTKTPTAVHSPLSHSCKALSSSLCGQLSGKVRQCDRMVTQCRTYLQCVVTLVAVSQLNMQAAMSQELGISADFCYLH